LDSGEIFLGIPFCPFLYLTHFSSVDAQPFGQVNFDNLMGSLSGAGQDSDGELDGEMTTDTER